MDNKGLIAKLRDNAELAWASYGYFDLIGKRFETKKVDNIGRQSTPIITHIDILDMTYNDYKAVELNPHKQDDEIKVGILKGDMTPLQAKRLFERYDLLIHQPNTKSGFSATLFKDKTTKQYTLAFLGTELSFNQALKDVATAESASIIKALYTYNVSLESKSVA